MTTLDITMNGRTVRVEITPAAERALAARTEPLYVELELYFSCLVKKFVHFRTDSRGKPTVPVGDKLLLYFRPVTSTACTWDVAERLGRQPEMDIDSAALHHVAPRRVTIDYADNAWRGRYEFL
ncbi:MAG: hypothetical protein RBS28_05535 [Rhodocyclaceae bacterium]|jgi:hypothetical protein|nr:hypothetical protein [Rhodocyclaceae bacterium]